MVFLIYQIKIYKLFQLYYQHLRIMKKTLIFLLLVVLIATKTTVGLAWGAQTAQKNIGTCAKYTSDKESCLQCVPHYHLFEGQCYIDIHGCSQYVFGNICRKCQNGFILVNNQCCDKHCMSRIFKNYEAANEQSELTSEQKIERKITEGYEKTVQSLTVFRYQFVKFSLQSTSNQILHGYVRYFIKILANEKPYKCIADFETDTKKVFVLQFRLESEMSSIKQVILSQQDVVSNDEARIALQYTSGKYGLRTYGSSLQRVSYTPYKYGSQFKLIYIGSESAMIIHIVVPNGGNKKQNPYSPWSQERKDAQAIRNFVTKSLTVVKMKNLPDVQLIKQKVSETSSIKTEQVELKTIEKVRQNVYKYTFVNEQTKQTFEQVTKVDPKTKTVEIVQHKQVIRQDIKDMKLPESPQKKIIPREQIPETREVKQVVKYLEEVQPSLANKQIVSAVVETIGENKKITLVQTKNDQITRTVILENQRTKQFKLVDESPVVTTPPTSTTYTTSPEGKPIIRSTDVEKFKKIDNQTETVITTIQSKLTSINTTNIQSLEKTEGNLVNTYQVVIKPQKPDQPKQQITVIQNVQTKEVKIIDVEEIPTPVIVEPIKRQPTHVPKTEFKAPEIQSILQSYKKTQKELKDTEVVIKKADIQENKFVNQYTIVVQTVKGQTLTIKANKPHDQKQPEITSVKAVYQKQTQKTVEQPYVSKIQVNEITGVKTVTSSKKEDIIVSSVTKVLSEIKSTKVEAKVEQIQSVVRKQYQKTIMETVLIKEEDKYIQVTVEQDKKTGTVKKVHQEIVKIQVKQSEPSLPVTTSTQISSTTFNQIVKVNSVLKNISEKVVESYPVLAKQTPIMTEIQQKGSVQIVTLVYENKTTNLKERLVTQYNQETKKTTIIQQTALPKVIQPVRFEKDKTPEGDVRIVSNKIEQIKKEDTHITNVMQQVSEKFPIVKENSVKFEVVTNEFTNTYQITAKQPKTKETVTFSVSYSKQTDKVTINDIQQTPKSQLVITKPVPKPVVVLSKEESTKTEVKNVVEYVNKVVNTQQIRQIKQTKNTLSTNYEITTQTNEGVKTILVVVDKNNPKDITLIDVIPEKPAQPSQPAPFVPYYTTGFTDVANVKDTTTNDQALISSNKYLKTVSEEALRTQPLLQSQNIICFSQDIYLDTTHITYLARVNSVTVMVSGFVKNSDNTVNIVQVPSSGVNGLNPSSIQQCQQRSKTISTLMKETITTLRSTDSQIINLVKYIKSNFSTQEFERVIVERFTENTKYVIMVTINKMVQRVVLIFRKKTSEFVIIESPNPVKLAKPTILEQRVQSDGTKVTISNTFEQVKSVDQKVEKFMTKLSEQVTVKQTDIVNLVVKQSTNTNQYSITTRTDKGTNVISAIFKKDDQSIILTKVQQQPQPLITPNVKPKVTLTKEEYTTTSVQKVIEQINKNPKVPNITSQKIVDIVVTKNTLTTNYQVKTETTKGIETFVLTETSKGDVSVIDYKPVKPQPAPLPSKTEYTVNTVSGFQTRVTNDVKIIQNSKPIQSVVATIMKSESLSKNTEVVSAVTKTSDNTVQTTIVTRNPEKPEQKTVVVAFVDKKTNNVTIVAQKTVQVTEEQETTISQQVVQTVYTTTIIQKTIKQDKKLQKIINKVKQNHRQVVKETLPTEVLMEKVGNVVVSTVSYEGKHVSTLVYDQKTQEVKEIVSQPVPTNIKSLLYETERTVEGNTVITTNSVEKITEVTNNFQNIISEIKQKIPSILTEKIEGIRVLKSDDSSAPQKIIIVFQTEKIKQNAQVTIINEPKRQKITIIDVQTILQDELIPRPQPVRPVKLSQEQIKNSKIQSFITTHIKQLPVKSVKNVSDVTEVKTAYRKVLETKVEDNQGVKYLVRTQQIGEKQPTIIDYVKIPDVKKQEIFTLTSTNGKNGIVSTYTNDLKVMSDEKTFNKCIDVLEKQKSLTKNGYTVDSQTYSKYQRSVEHHIRFINKQTKEGVDYRIIVDSRTGQVSINEQQKITLIGNEPSTVPAEKSYVQIIKSELPSAQNKYPFIKNCLQVLSTADYTFQGKIPDLTQIKQYKSITTGNNGVEVIMTFPVTIGGSVRKTRVVFLGEQKQPGKGFIMKIIDITTLPEVIPTTQTRVSYDQYNRKVVETTDVVTLEKNSQQYTRVIEKIRDEVPSLSSSQVSSVVVKEFKNVNEYTVLTKKGTEVIEIKSSFNKATEQVTLVDFKTQSTKTNVEKVPMRQIQSIVSEVSKDKLQQTQFTTLRKEIIKQQNLPEDLEINSVKIEQNPKIDTYVVRVTHTKKIQGQAVAIRNPSDQLYTVISYKPDVRVQPEPVRTKDSTTQIKIDEVTGAQVVTTNDIKVIKSTEIIQNVVTKMTEDKSFYKTSQVLSAVTKTSQNKIQTTVVIQDKSKPNLNKVVVAIADKKDQKKVEIISSYTVETEQIEQTEETEEVTTTQLIEEVVITQVVYQTMIKKDTHLQKIVKEVERKYTEVKNVTPIRVVMQQVGERTISEVTYENKKVTVITNQKQEIISTFEQPIPKLITPGTVQTTITKEGTKTITATSSAIMETIQPQYTVVLKQVTKKVQNKDIKTVVSQQTLFGKVFTVISQRPEQPEPQQTVYYLNKQTQQITNMGVEQISIVNTVQFVSEPQPTKPVSETKWQTKQVKTVIEEVTNVVHQEKVLKVEQLKSAPTTKFYQVTVETTKGPEIVTVTVDKSTKQVKVINQKQQIQFTPSLPTEQVPQIPSETKVIVDETTGVKTTTTTDLEVIKQDKMVTKVYEKIVKQSPELKRTEVVSTTTKNYETTIEETIVLQSEQKTTKVVTIIDKKTEQIKILDQSTIDSSRITTATNEVKITSNIFESVFNTDELLRRAIQFVSTKFPQWTLSKPTTTNFEQISSSTVKFTFVYFILNKQTRFIVVYSKISKTFELIETPSQVTETKPIVLQTSKTQTGRTVIFTNDVETISQKDTKFTSMFTQLQKETSINEKEVKSIQSTQTSTGRSYIITTQKQSEQNQIVVLYNSEDNKIKITDMETVKQVLPQPTPRHPIILSKDQYQNEQVTFVIQKSITQHKIPSFTVSQVSKIVKTSTSFGRTYVFDINTKDGTAELTSSITTTSISSTTSQTSSSPSPSQSTTDRKVTVISYKAPVSKQQKPLISEAPSETYFSVDSVTGTKVQSTNNIQIIKQSTVTQNVLSKLSRTQVVPVSSTVTSVVSKQTVNNIQSTMVVKTSETDSKVIVTITDKKTNDVRVIAEKPVPKEEIQQPDITKLVPQTVISSTIYEQVIQKDVTLQNVIKVVKNNHPQITQKPTRIVEQKVGEKTVTEVSYKDITYTVTTQMKTGKVEEITYSTLPKPADRKPVILEQITTEEGFKIVTSNKIEHIEKVVPSVRAAITQVTKLVPIKTEQIKTITSSIEEKQFTVVTVDSSNKVKEIKFTYEPQRTKPVKLIDVQEFSEQVIISKPKQIVYEKITVEQKPEIVKAIQIVNRTSTVIKNDVTQIVKIEKAVTNFVDQYKAQVKTHTKEQATIIFQINPVTKEAVVIDLIKYEPLKQQPQPVVVQQRIDSVTQTRQTVFPNIQTFKHDQTYEKVTEYLQTEITKGYEIVSVVKENYGENKQVNILLKSENTSPQQIQLNINSFNNEVTVLQNKTITREDEETTVITQEQPKTVELKLSPVDQEKFDIITKLQNVKQEQDFNTVPEIKQLEKNELFKKADQYLKTQYESLLQQSNVVHVVNKQTLDSQEYKVYYVNTEKNDKQVYEAKFQINPVTQTYVVKEFNIVGATKPEKSNLNIGADIAYGYQPLQNFSNDKNIDFVVAQTKKHYPNIANGVVQSVEVLGLCDRRFNYKIYFKSGLEVVKFIIYFEESFQRVVFIEGKEFNFGTDSFETVPKNQLLGDGYFKTINQNIKEKNQQISEGSEVVVVQRKDKGVLNGYRIIYSKGGKTYHAEGDINKDNMAVEMKYFTQIIEVPVVQQQVQSSQTSSTSVQNYATLRINDLAHNSNFERVHRQILSKEGGFLQNAQLIGAQQQSEMFKVTFRFFFLIKQDHYKIDAQIDSTTKKVTILSELQKINTESGFTTQNSGENSQEAIEWALKRNSDLKSGVIVQASSKNEMFGRIYKLIFKLQTKYIVLVVYKQGNDFKVLSQTQTTSMDSSPTVRSLPRPNPQNVTVNKK